MKKLIVGALSCSLLLLAGCRNNLVEPKHKSSAADYAIIQSSHKQSHKKVEKEKPKNKDDKKEKSEKTDQKKDEDIKKLYEAHVRSKNFGDIRTIDVNELPEIDLFTYSFPVTLL